MAHEKVYAICEDKCKEETLVKDDIISRDTAVLGESKGFAAGMIEQLQNLSIEGAKLIEGDRTAVTGATTLEELKLAVTELLDDVAETFRSFDKYISRG